MGFAGVQCSLGRGSSLFFFVIVFSYFSRWWHCRRKLVHYWLLLVSNIWLPPGPLGRSQSTVSQMSYWCSFLSLFFLLFRIWGDPSITLVTPTPVGFSRPLRTTSYIRQVTKKTLNKTLWQWIMEHKQNHVCRCITQCSQR